jgi:hypothetical protein
MSSKPVYTLNTFPPISTVANADANADSGGKPSSVDLISGQVYA